MSRKLTSHLTTGTPEGFQWDGTRITEFANFFGGNFCYIANTATLVIDSDRMEIGDWIVIEGEEYQILSDEVFHEDFDIV